jgi:hypothetical protein
MANPLQQSRFVAEPLSGLIDPLEIAVAIDHAVSTDHKGGVRGLSGFDSQPKRCALRKPIVPIQARNPFTPRKTLLDELQHCISRPRRRAAVCLESPSPRRKPSGNSGLKVVGAWAIEQYNQPKTRIVEVLRSDAIKTPVDT